MSGLLYLYPQFLPPLHIFFLPLKTKRKVPCFVVDCEKEVNWDLKFSLSFKTGLLYSCVLTLSSTVASSLTRNGIWPQIIPPCIHFLLSSFHRCFVIIPTQKYSKLVLSCFFRKGKHRKRQRCIYKFLMLNSNEEKIEKDRKLKIDDRTMTFNHNFWKSQIKIKFSERILI